MPLNILTNEEAVITFGLSIIAIVVYLHRFSNYRKETSYLIAAGRSFLDIMIAILLAILIGTFVYFI